MNRKTLATIAILAFMSGCPLDCGPTPTDPCEGVNCNHGTCSVVSDQPVCTCNDGWEGNCDQQNLCFGLDLGNGAECDKATGVVTCMANWYDSTKKCECEFVPEDHTTFLFCKLYNPSDSGRLELSGLAGADSRYNGYHVDIQAGTFARPAWVCLKKAQGQNLPDPNRPGGKLLPTATGIDVSAIDDETPFLAGCKYNTLEPTLDTELLLYGHRGTVLFYNDSTKAFEDVSFTIVSTGSLGKTRHFSPYYLLDTLPTLEAAAMQESGMTVLVDFDGTTDEQSGTMYFLDLSATEGGIPQALTPVAGQDKKFRMTLSGGTHSIVFKVLDPNGSVAEKTRDVVVDLCKDVDCPIGQICQIVDGICRDDNDPCTPSPCVHGTCSNTTGQAVCACSGNWSGGLCDTCPPGFYTDGSGNCVTDHCHNVTCDDGNPCDGTETCDRDTGCISGTPVICPDDGDKCNGSEACDTADGQCKHYSPVTCPDDNNVCNGTEQCETATGACIHASPLTCDDGLVCNGVETCNPTTGCTNPADETCSGHGTCQEPPAAICACGGNWTGTRCETCPAGYTGTDCHVDLCYLQTCSGHGTCNPSDGSCGCDTGYAGASCGSCAVGYENYPTCSADTTPPPAPVITTCVDTSTSICPEPPGGWDPAQANITIHGTCNGADTAMIQVRIKADSNPWGSWQDITYTAGSNDWTWSTTTILSGVTYTIEFRALDFVPGGNPSGSDQVIVNALY